MSRFAGARRTTPVWAAVLAGVLLSGCGPEYYEERGKSDAPVWGKVGDGTPAEVYNFPDGFGNVASKCVGPGGAATRRPRRSSATRRAGRATSS
ncbi:hypothetical protein ACFQ60_07390 [Streptomyces zhihengii]